MDIDTARALARGGFRSAAALGDLLPILKEGCSPDEYATRSAGIAAAINLVMTNTVDAAIENHKVLAAEIDGEIRKHGTYR